MMAFLFSPLGRGLSALALFLLLELLKSAQEHFPPAKSTLGRLLAALTLSLAPVPLAILAGADAGETAAMSVSTFLMASGAHGALSAALGRQAGESMAKAMKRLRRQGG